MLECVEHDLSPFKIQVLIIIPDSRVSRIVPVSTSTYKETDDSLKIKRVRAPPLFCAPKSLPASRQIDGLFGETVQAKT
jgi:hypothetical protein